jgi:hypothetical protein
MRRTLLERMSSSKTARGDTSPPYSFTNRLKEAFPPPKASEFGSPLRVRKRGSVSHPSTTRSQGALVARSESRLAVVLSIRLISFRGKPVRAATFELLTFPFLSRELAAAARTNALRARVQNLSGVIPRGSSARANSLSRCCRSAWPPSVSLRARSARAELDALRVAFEA